MTHEELENEVIRLVNQQLENDKIMELMNKRLDNHAEQIKLVDGKVTDVATALIRLNTISRVPTK